MSESLIATIVEQVDVLFVNIQTLLDEIAESHLQDEHICEWILAEQICHLLSSMEQWLTYQGAELVCEPEAVVGQSRASLVEYAVSVRRKAIQYLQTLKPENLSECPPGCKHTRMDLILGQFRHSMYHLGHIHGCLRARTGESPEYVSHTEYLRRKGEVEREVDR